MAELFLTTDYLHIFQKPQQYASMFLCSFERRGKEP